MSKLITYISCFIFIYSNSFALESEFLYKTFDDSMHAPTQVTDTDSYKLAKKVYELRNPKILHQHSIDAIPKTIHQIWLGPKEIPQEYLENSKKWQKLHPTWDYKLWREADIADWNFLSKDLFDKASSYQEKADLLRYEILNKHGGLYVDMDYKPLKNFDYVHEKYFFYGSIEPIFSAKQNMTVANSIIASTPNNKIFTETLNKIRNHWDQVESSFRKEALNIKGKKNLIHLAVNRTMRPFNDAVLKNIETIDNALLFPSTYMSIEEKDSIYDKLRISLGVMSNKLYFRIPKEETMAVQKRGKRIISNLANVQLKESWYQLILDKF